jgi:Protein of unknown function (DUF1194)
MKSPVAVVVLLFAIFFPLRAFAEADEVDLALVLAVDASGSVDAREFRLQLDGIAYAVTSDDVVAAALSGPRRKIAVNFVTWGDPDEPKFQTGWRIIASRADALSFASEVRTGLPRQGGGTGLGVAVGYGLALLRNSGIHAARSVIDVSGDGPESWELREPRFKLPQAHIVREAEGVTVNGLAILTDRKDLVEYYHANVIGGAGSFVMSANVYEDFAQAMRRKLLREILPPVSKLQ